MSWSCCRRSLVSVFMSLKSNRKLIPCFALFCLLVLSIQSAFSIEKTITLGGKEGWSKISSMSGITTGLGKYGQNSLELATASRTVSADTEMLFSFEGDNLKDDAGRFQVVNSNLRLVQDGAMGKQAGLSVGNNSGFAVVGAPGSIFSTLNWTGSFSMEFWLCPAVVDNGETVISWRSSRTVEGYPLYQILEASFARNHLQWNCTNLFAGYTENNGEITLSGTKSIIPGKWSHHILSYDAETGLLEYRVNGLVEDLKYITMTGGERGGVYPLMLGNPAMFEISPSYAGKIDDFRVLRNSIANTEDFFYQNQENYQTGWTAVRYTAEGGSFISEPLEVPVGSQLTHLEASTIVPEETDVEFFVRAGDNFYSWNQTSPAWVPAPPGKLLSGVEGKYFQVMVKLYPDGAGTSTPSVASVTLCYEEHEPPLPPFYVKATAGNGYVDLIWSHTIDKATNYCVYYGERPGEYLGRVALEGDSPVKVGHENSVRLTGLKNGRIYYFAIASEYNGQVGPLSQEVYARPTIQSYD